MEVYATFWSLLPPVIAIALALITKEVYSSLFIGIVSGALLYSGFDIVAAFEHIFFGQTEIDGETVIYGLIPQISTVGTPVFWYSLWFWAAWSC